MNVLHIYFIHIFYYYFAYNRTTLMLWSGSCWLNAHRHLSRDPTAIPCCSLCVCVCDIYCSVSTHSVLSTQTAGTQQCTQTLTKCVPADTQPVNTHPCYRPQIHTNTRTQENTDTYRNTQTDTHRHAKGLSHRHIFYTCSLSTGRCTTQNCLWHTHRHTYTKNFCKSTTPIL